MGLKDDVVAVILAHENNWNDGKYPLDIPKCLIEYEDETLLENMLRACEAANISDVVIALGENKDQVYRFLENTSFSGEIHTLEVQQGEENGSIIKRAMNILQKEKVIISLGDNYFDTLELSDVLYYHNNANTRLSIVVKPLDKG